MGIKVLCVGIFIAPKCATLMGRCTAMTATGSKVARHWLSTMTVTWNWCNGRQPLCPGGRATRPGLQAHEIALITDAWRPQINGVLTTLVELVREIECIGHQINVIHPGLFTTRPCPGYAGIDLAVRPP